MPKKLKKVLAVKGIFQSDHKPGVGMWSSDLGRSVGTKIKGLRLTMLQDIVRDS